MKITVHAGHNPDGKVACGAAGYVRESTEARLIKDEVISILSKLGHDVFDCTVNDGSGQSDVLKKIVNKCNMCEPVDLHLSLHLNAFNGSAHGVECYVFSKNKQNLAVSAGLRVCDRISALGYKNRGLKENPKLYFLNKTKNPALLVECCFVDNPNDIAMYSPQAMAKAIVEGILGIPVSIDSTIESEMLDHHEESYTRDTLRYVVECGAFDTINDANALMLTLANFGYHPVIRKV